MHASRRLAIPSDHQYTAPPRRVAPDRGKHESQMACKSHLSRVAPASTSSSVGDSSDQVTAMAAAALKSSSQWVTAHRGNPLLLPSGRSVGPLALSQGSPIAPLTATSIKMLMWFERVSSPWVCPRKVHYGLSPPRHTHAGRSSVHKPEVERGRPVLHVAPSSVGPTGTPRR